MVKDDRKNKLLANAVANLKRDKIGMGVQNFANENNLWRSQGLRFENILKDEVDN